MSSIILTQTDTTVGFLSQNEKKLYEIKSRETSKPFLKVYPDFQNLLISKNRIPNSFKRLVRHSKKTTFIIKQRAFRVAKNSLNSQILKNQSWQYSTSANKTGENFNREFCQTKADIIIEDINGLSENDPSSLIKINRAKKRKLR